MKRKNSYDPYRDDREASAFLLGQVIFWAIALFLLVVALTFVYQSLRPRLLEMEHEANTSSTQFIQSRQATLSRWQNDYVSNQTLILQYKSDNEGGKWDEIISNLQLQNEGLLRQMCQEAVDISEFVPETVSDFFVRSNAPCAEDY